MRSARTLAAIALAALPLIAAAHAHLKQTTPADGSVVQTAPQSLALSFTEPAHLTALSVQKQGDAQPRKIGPLPRDASQEFRLPAPQLEPGVYTLRYRVVAADDNHVTSGMVTFSIAAPGP